MCSPMILPDEFSFGIPAEQPPVEPDTSSTKANLEETHGHSDNPDSLRHGML